MGTSGDRRDDTSAAYGQLQHIGEQLKAQLQAHHDEVRDVISDQLGRAADRERAVAAALDSLTDQLNQFTAQLARELRRAGEETVQRASTELAEAAQVVSGARVDLVAESIGRVDARVARLAADLEAQRQRPDPAPDTAAVAAPADDAAVRELRSDLAALAATVQDGLAALADRPTPLTPEHLESVLDELHEALTDGPAPATSSDVAAIREGLDALATALAIRPAATTGDIASLRDSIDQLAARLDQQPAQPAPGAAELASLREGIDQLAARLDQQQAPSATEAPTGAPELAELRTILVALANRPVASRDDLAPLHQHLDEVTRALADALGDKPVGAGAGARPVLDLSDTAIGGNGAGSTPLGAHADDDAPDLADAPLERRLEVVAEDAAQLQAWVERLQTSVSAAPADADLDAWVEAAGRIVRNAARSLRALEAAALPD